MSIAYIVRCVYGPVQDKIPANPIKTWCWGTSFHDQVVEEASSIGLPPGFWPEQLTYKGKTFTKYKMEIDNNEVVSVEYHNGTVTLTLFND